MLEVVISLVGAITALTGLIVWMQKAFLRHIGNHEKHTEAAILRQAVSNERLCEAVDDLTDAIHGYRAKADGPYGPGSSGQGGSKSSLPPLHDDTRTVP